MGRRTGQHHGDLRRALLDAALAIVDEGAIEGLTLRGVARRAGVSPGAPYHHFADKDALLAAVAEEGFVALRRAQHLDRHDPDAALMALCATYVRFARAHRAHYAVMWRRRPGQLPEQASAPLRTAALATFGVLVAAVAAVRPELDEAEHRARAVQAWALAHGGVLVGEWVDDLPGGRVDVLSAEAIGAASLRIVLG